MDREDMRVRLEQLNRNFSQTIPHNKALGLEIVDLGEGTARFLLPYDERLVGNPETGVLHGGAVTTLIDSCCGAAVFMGLREPTTIATLDLRIDYLRAAEPGKAVTATAHCYHITHNVAFVRGLAFHDSEDQPIAAAAGSFMIGTRSRREPGKKSGP